MHFIGDKCVCESSAIGVGVRQRCYGGSIFSKDGCIREMKAKVLFWITVTKMCWCVSYVYSNYIKYNIIFDDSMCKPLTFEFNFLSGDISGSGRSTPDSSHNNSPEMKRKMLDLHTLSAEPRPFLLSQDKSPMTSATCKIIPRSVSSATQDRSPCSNSSQSFPAPQPTTERPPSTQSSKAGTPTSSETLMNVINSEKRGLKKYGGKSKGHIKLLQTPFIDGSSVSMSTGRK